MMQDSKLLEDLVKDVCCCCWRLGPD